MFHFVICFIVSLLPTVCMYTVKLNSLLPMSLTVIYSFACGYMFVCLYSKCGCDYVILCVHYLYKNNYPASVQPQSNNSRLLPCLRGTDSMLPLTYLKVIIHHILWLVCCSVADMVRLQKQLSSRSGKILHHTVDDLYYVVCRGNR